MWKYIVIRMGQMIPAGLGVMLIVFLLVRLSGDPAVLMLGVGATEEEIEMYREEKGLNDPLFIQFVRFLNGALHGDLGDSLRQGAPALDIVLERVPATLELAAGSLIIPIMAGIFLGVFTALKANSSIDVLTRGLILFGQAIPNFYLGLLLILVFGAQLKILPTGGYGTWRHLVLPSISLGLYQMAVYTRFARSALLEVLGQDYLRTARAKGLHERVVILSHALKNAMIPIISMTGLTVGTVLSGAVVTETVFSWPGIGRLAIQSILARDFPVVQAVVLLVTFVFIAVNLLVDVTYALIDPRIRYQG